MVHTLRKRYIGKEGTNNTIFSARHFVWILALLSVVQVYETSLRVSLR